MSDIPPVHIDTSASTATARALPPQASSPLSPSEQLAEGFFGSHKAEKKKELQERGILKVSGGKALPSPSSGVCVRERRRGDGCGPDAGRGPTENSLQGFNIEGLILFVFISFPGRQNLPGPPGPG